jgi:hypothetical protein
MKKGDDAFRTFLNDTIEKAYESGAWKKAFDKTVGEAGEKAPEPPDVDRYTSGSASGATTTTAAGAATTTTTAKP